ncbi:MAG TPA: O-antigen ligase family protein, partial [Longimicrobiales bacterium]
VGVTYSGQPEYGTFKATAYILENAFMVSLAALFYGDPDRIERFLKALAASGWLLGLIAGAWLLEAGFEMMGRLHPESYNPLQFARSVAMSIIGCFAVFLIRYRRGEFRPTALAFVPVGLGLMLLSGGKGPLLSLVASLIVLIFLAQKTRSLAVRALRMGAILLVLAAGAVAAFPFLPVAVQERLMPTLSQTAYAGSIGARIDRMAHGWRMFREAPILGHGTGSFVFGGQIGDYPHNILLELLSENGLIGLFLWTGLLCVGLLAVHRGIRSQTRLSSVAQPTAVATAAVTALLVLSIVAAMFSFNIVGNSSIWFFLGMLYMRHPGCGAVRTVHRGEQDLTACAPKLTGPVAPEAIAGVHVL